MRRIGWLGLAAAGALAAPAVAQDCNTNGNPTPPAPVQDSRSGTLGSYQRATFGQRGCDGASGKLNQSGQAGWIGQPAGDLTVGFSAATLTGPWPTVGDPAYWPTYGALAGIGGGRGGSGGDAGGAWQGGITGGDGGAGNGGGTVTVTFSGAFAPGSGIGAPDTGLSVGASGGQGGPGGRGLDGGIFASQGGDGGIGGTGGHASFSFSGQLAANLLGLSSSSYGGYGGDGGFATTRALTTVYGGTGGPGGAGGGATLDFTGGTVSAAAALVVVSQGGGGGKGGNTEYAMDQYAGRGGKGGDGGSASVTVAGAARYVPGPAGSAPTSVVTVRSVGGTGGAGGQTNGGLGAGGGSGGGGGAGGSAAATLAPDAGVTLAGSADAGVQGFHGVLVQSNGGLGGVGGTTGAPIGRAGGGGIGGAGGSASLNLNGGTLTTSGAFAHGALLQSVGGGGGDAGQATGLWVSGGGGGAGGAAGPVSAGSAAGGTVVSVSGMGAVPLLAQSVGGGGGSGGNATSINVGTGLALGGNGGLGGSGGAVTLDLKGGVFASTGASGGSGVLAQSIGGAGGAAGSASSRGVGVISYVVGGDGGMGAPAGNVSVTSGALVTTYGDHAAGLEAQSVGGGGGKGGAAISLNVGAGVMPSVAIAVGGRGGGGGAAGGAAITNSYQVTTYGPDAFGVKAQSIGGGGGSGGASAATAVALSPDSKIPAISAAVAVGGAGGAGNTGGGASVTNAGFVNTAGHGAHAVFAQSVGGGGGAAGDASASSFSGGKGDFALSFSTALGGSGGSGATGGPVSVTNRGLLLTFGQDAYAVFAQSVGGGGGAGGTGDASASAADSEKLSFSVAVAVGGGGGSGGTGGKVTISNASGIATVGDGADGVFAQSVGGGGGAAGGGVANAAGGTLSVAVGVGGNGGSGGDGGAVTIANTGGIVTRGADAPAVTAQSVGGGGGRAGKGGATAGGAPEDQASALYDTLKNGLNLDQKVTEVIDGVFEVADGVLGAISTIEQLQKIAEALDGKGSSGLATSVNIGVSVGGKGGAAGRGGDVQATNAGNIATSGAHSDGILAQSVGGGGGMGGVANSNSEFDLSQPIQFEFALGGQGGAGGDGGAVTVANGDAGKPGAAQISTAGVSAFGIAAQSVGGGGGRGAMSGAADGTLLGLALALGGAGGTSGNGQAVLVTSPGAVATRGKHAIGVFAQSVGGGGGLAKAITQDQAGDQGDDDDKADSFTPVFAFGKNGSGGGSGGPVEVDAYGIATAGRNAHGVLAQSVGGGGGMAVGGQAKGLSFFFAGSGGSGGAGGAVTVKLSGALQTAGDGAAGVWAQSIGGGGGIAGDAASSSTGIGGSGNSGASGSGGAVAVSVGSDARIDTLGANADGIYAQSIGGGGGHVTTAAGIVRGAAGGDGAGGDVVVTVAGPVSVKGAGSSGVKAQSDGRTSGKSAITVTSSVSATGGGATAAAISLLGGTGNTIGNSGQITGGGGGGAGYAILADSAAANTTVTNTGTITGAQHFAGAGAFVDNRPGGTIVLGRVTNLGEGGRLRNAGTLMVGPPGRPGRTELSGDLHHTRSGRLVVDIDAENGATDLITLNGVARLEGRLVVHPISLARTTAPVMTAVGGLVVHESFDAAPAHVFTFAPLVNESTLDVAIDADFAAGQGAQDRRSLARYLQRIWDGGRGGFGAGFADLAGVSGRDYGRALDTISGRGLAGIGLGRVDSGQRIARTGFSCQAFVGGGLTLAEQDCGWMRIIGTDGDSDRTGSQPDYGLRATTTALGGQREIAPGWFLGGAIGYETSRLRADDNRTRVDGDATVATLALKRQEGPLLLAGAIDFGYGWYDSSRRVDLGGGGIAAASPRAWNAGLHLRGAWQHSFDRWYLQPGLDLDAGYARLDGFTERGAGPYNLRVASSDEVVLAATPTLKVGSRMDLEGGTVLHVWSAAGVSFYSGNDFAIDARLAGVSGAGEFGASLAGPDVAGRISAGIDVMSEGRFNVRLEAHATTGSEWHEHGGEVRVEYRF